MKLFTQEMWAVWVALGLMLVAAAVNARTLRVPNRLSLTAMLAGWGVALAVSCSAGVPSNGGGIVPSLAATSLAFALLLPGYWTGGLGAGCVKMQMAFAAWTGCAVSLTSAACITTCGTLIGEIITAIAVGITRRRLRARSDGNGLLTPFPAQTTLSLGTVIGVIVSAAFGWME